MEFSYYNHKPELQDLSIYSRYSQAITVVCIENRYSVYVIYIVLSFCCRREAIQMYVGGLHLEICTFRWADTALPQAHWCQALPVPGLWAQLLSLGSPGPAQETPPAGVSRDQTTPSHCSPLSQSSLEPSSANEMNSLSVPAQKPLFKIYRALSPCDFPSPHPIQDILLVCALLPSVCAISSAGQRTYSQKQTHTCTCYVQRRTYCIHEQNLHCLAVCLSELDKQCESCFIMNAK